MEGKTIDIRLVSKIVSGYGDDQDSNLIAILQQTQDNYGYLPKQALKEVSRLTDVPLTRIFGIVTFYSQFTLIPRGRHAIKICTGTACHVKGVNDVKQKVKESIKRSRRRDNGRLSIYFGNCGLHRNMLSCAGNDGR